MKSTSCITACLLLVSTACGQDPKFDAPGVKLPDAKTMELIQQQMVKLRESIKALPEKTPDEVRVDVEIFLKAAEWAVRHNEFYDGGKSAVAVLERGLQRAQEAAAGKPAWLEVTGKTVVRAYRSKVDESLQPYAVSYPADFGKDKSKKWRLDVVLHGRDSTICETKFLSQHNGKIVPKDRDFVQIDIYGRGNNAYRWAGETDVFEATFEETLWEATNRKAGNVHRARIDPQRRVLRGFSMGGAGTWHLGLHNPTAWCVIGPGAGFTTTHSYVKSLPNPLPLHQERLLHIYDAVDYAENAFDLPIVAYSGEKDAQKAAADNIEKRLKELKIDTMTHLIAPGLMHQFPAEWQAKAEMEYAKHAAMGKAEYPNHIRFVTYTLKYPGCNWIHLLELEQHYEQARVDATFEDDVYKITTKNVMALRLWGFGMPMRPAKGSKAIIDGQDVRIRSAAENGWEKIDGKWTLIEAPLYGFHCDGSRKVSSLQGPIDDAFMSGFLCVKGSQMPWNEGPAKFADAQLQRFEKEWDKWMRGKLIVKADKDVTEADIQSKHLILFGDPASNTLVAKVLPKLPITWTKEQLNVGGQKYESAKYLPMLIYPNPLNPKKYVVLNSGHTFHEAEFKGTNALLFPRLGDWAVVRPAPTAKEPAAFDVMNSGIFDDSWRFSEK